MSATKYMRKKSSLLAQLESFLASLPHAPSVVSASPTDVCRFLVWKDQTGKTSIHHRSCPAIGVQPKTVICSCPTRLSSGTVDSLIGQLRSIFEAHGRGHVWALGALGNPACSKEVKDYACAVRLEQARAHVLPTQAPPMFLAKLGKIMSYINLQLSKDDVPVREKFVYLRDRAFLLLQFFAGDRAGDLGLMLSQEVKRLSDDSGVVITHTLGKPLRGQRNGFNTFVVKRCSSLQLCPVRALEEYFQFSKSHGIDLSLGYLFRPVNNLSVVLTEPLPYSTVYMRLKSYLRVLGLDDGETPHSLRSGCAITMVLSGAAESQEEVLGHVGWLRKETMDHYVRYYRLRDSQTLASRFAEVAGQSSFDAQNIYNQHVKFLSLSHAFNSL